MSFHPTYLNPVDLFRLRDRRELTAGDLRKAKRRFYSELILEERDFFTHHGISYGRHDLDEVIAAAKEPDVLAALVYAANHPALDAFLRTGVYAPNLRDELRNDLSAYPYLREPFAQAFNHAFARAFWTGAHRDMSALLALPPYRAFPNPHALFKRTRQVIADRQAAVFRTIDNYLSGPTRATNRHLSRARVFKRFLPRKVVSRLPADFSDLTGQIARDTYERAYTLDNHHNDHASAHYLLKAANALPHLSPRMREALRENIRTTYWSMLWGSGRPGKPHQRRGSIVLTIIPVLALALAPIVADGVTHVRRHLIRQEIDAAPPPQRMSPRERGYQRGRELFERMDSVQLQQLLEKMHETSNRPQ